MLFNNMAQAEMVKMFASFWNKVEGQRVSDAQKLWYWYANDKDEVTACIKAALEKIFTRKKTVKKMNIRVFLVVDRIISRLAKVYKNPAVRALDGGAKVKTEGDKETTDQSKSDEIYQELILNSTLNKEVKEFEKLLVLFNTCLMQPVWRENPGEDPYMDFMIHTPAWTVVEWDEQDYLRPVSFYYPIWATVGETYQQVLVYWSATEHFYVDKQGNRYTAPGMNGMENPYGVLPVALARVKKTTDGWGEGMWDLVEGNEEVCVQATNLYYNAIWQSHGQPVSINMGLKGEPEVGPDKPLVAENASRLEQQPSNFFFANANPMITEVRELIDWTLKMMQSLKGITGHSIQLDPAIQSGISKIQDSAEIQESRTDMIGILEEFEHDLYRVVRTIWNYHNPTKKIDEKAVFSIHFADPKVLKSVDEKTKERDAALKQGTASRIDFIMEDHPEMSREDAENKLEQNLLEDRRFKDQFGIMDTTVNDNQVENQNVNQ